MYLFSVHLCQHVLSGLQAQIGWHVDTGHERKEDP